MSDAANADKSLGERTLEAERGRAKCQLCPRTGHLSDFITVFFGGGLLVALCQRCAGKGHEIRIRRGERGIEVHAKRKGILTVAQRDLDVIMKRPNSE